MLSKKRMKFIIGFVVIVLITWAAFEGVPKYQNWQKWRNIKKQAEEFEIKQKELESLIKADTYGGKTPQETLEMFIKAVEAGDYELASRYFVVEKQEEELKKLEETQKNSNIDFLLKFIREAKTVGGYFSNNNSMYIIKKPIFISLTIYPSNIWKINEI